jgi:sugar phosphate isomerase/epimerase
MDLGILTTTFSHQTPEETFAAVAQHGFPAVQFDFANAGLSTLPDEIPPELVDRVRRAAVERGVAIAAVSGTYNMVHPNRREREAGLRRIAVLADACAALGSPIVTLCTGTREPGDMWRRHPDNDTPAAWDDLVEATRAALAVTESAGVTLALEPEPGNVLRTARQGRELIETIGNPRLGAVLDPANLFDRFEPGEAGRFPEILDDAVALLGDRIVLAHGKDRAADGTVRPAGQGIVPWERVVALLRSVGYDGPLIVHGLGEPEIGASVAFLRTVSGSPIRDDRVRPDRLEAD